MPPDEGNSGGRPYAGLPVLPGCAASDRRRRQRNARHRASDHAGQAHPPSALWLPSLRRAPWCRRLRRRVRSTVGCRRRHCWRTSRCRSSPGICRCTVRLRCWRATASISIASTLVHWIGRAAWWLKPLHALLRRDGDVGAESVLRRHAVASAGSHAAANAHRAALVLCGG